MIEHCFVYLAAPYRGYVDVVKTKTKTKIKTKTKTRDDFQTME